MGGISGILSPDPSDSLPVSEGPTFNEGGCTFRVRPRSTLARSDRLVVAISGHFDRAPSTGQSAAEVLLEAWERQGREALSTFEGAWVAAIYERKTGRLHLLRDPFGIRRLYFSHRGGRFAFATSPRALLDLPWVSRALARENVAEYLSFRYIHAPRTLLHDVQALPPGQHLVFEERSIRVEPWFKLKYCPPYTEIPDSPATLSELERRINRAVAARASGKERVGVFLSGGLDSSAITFFASRLGPVHTFTVGVSDAEGDETPYAARVANLLHTRHEVLRVDVGPFLDAFSTVVAGTDHPVTDPAAIPQYLLARQAREHVDVILSGDGGDEVFGGRMVGQVAQDLRLSTWMSRLPSPARRLLGSSVARRFPEVTDPTVPVGLARVIGGLQVFDRASRTALMRDPGWVRPGIRRMSLEPFYREIVSDPINEILHAWLRGRMPEDSLARAGAAASLAGIGLREPLLDRDLIGFCAGIPGPWKVRSGPGGSVTKWPLRQILRPVLGRAMVGRPKRVLPGPWKRWIQGPAHAFYEERLALLRADPLQLFMPGAIDTLASQIDLPGNDVRMWTLIFLDAWIRELRVT